MKLTDLMDLILEKNPSFDKENLAIRTNGNVEYCCTHDVGHTVYISGGKETHGCCEERCCINYNILTQKDLNSQE